MTSGIDNSIYNNDKFKDVSNTNVLKTFSAKFQKNIQNQESYNSGTYEVISDSIEDLHKFGKNKQAIALVETLFNKKDSIIDKFMVKSAGDVYRSIGDYNKGSSFVAFANSALKREYPDRQLSDLKAEKDFNKILDIKRSYTDSEVLEGKDITADINELSKVQTPESDILTLSLKAKVGDEENSEKYTNAAVLLEDIYGDNGNKENKINKAMILTKNGNYYESSKLCQQELNNLDSQKKGGTPDYATFLNINGINMYENKDYSNVAEAKKSFELASKISDASGDIQNKEFADYNLLRISYNQNNSEDYSKQAEKVDFSNKHLKQNVDLMTADLISQKDKDAGIDQYQKLLSNIYSENDENNPLKKIAETKINALDSEFNPNLITTKYHKSEKLTDAEKIICLSSFVQSNNFVNSKEISENIAKEYSPDPVMKNVGDTGIILSNMAEKNNNDFKFKTDSDVLSKKLLFLETSLKTTDNNKSTKALSKYLINAYDKLGNKFYHLALYPQACNAYQSEIEIGQNDSSMSNEAKANLYKKGIITTYKAFSHNDSNKLEYKKDIQIYGRKYLELSVSKDFADSLIKLDNNNNNESANDKQPDIDDIVSHNSQKNIKKAASVLETLAVVDMKTNNYLSAYNKFSTATELREKIGDRHIELANDYAGLSRIGVIYKFGDPSIYSEQSHKKSMDILDKYKSSDANAKSIYDSEVAFHKEYFGNSSVSVLKYLRFLQGFNSSKTSATIVDKFKFYSEEFGICE